MPFYVQVRIQSAAQIAPPSAYGMGGDSDDDDDVPAIPDLDDVQVRTQNEVEKSKAVTMDIYKYDLFPQFEDEDMALRVAEAPSVAVNRVATYRELDSDLLRHVAFATIDDIDLRLLTKGSAFSQEFLLSVKGYIQYLHFKF